MSYLGAHLGCYNGQGWGQKRRQLSGVLADCLGEDFLRLQLVTLSFVYSTVTNLGPEARLLVQCVWARARDQSDWEGETGGLRV